jgi:trigger factor
LEVTVENNKLNEVEHELRVSVPADYMRDELERGMAAVMQHAKIPGFRPGKIPRNVLVQKFGPAVTEDIVQRVLQEAYKDALDQVKLYPISPGEMSEIHFEPGQPLTFRVVVEILPEVVIPELSEIEVELKEPQAAEEDVETALLSLREAQAVLVPSEDPIDDHSVITFDMQELDESGVALIGKSQKDVSIDMSRQRFGEEFATKLTGLACEEKAVVEFQRAGATENVKSAEDSSSPSGTCAEVKSCREVGRRRLRSSVNPTLEFSWLMLRGDLRRYIEARAGLHRTPTDVPQTWPTSCCAVLSTPVPPRMLG